MNQAIKKMIMTMNDEIYIKDYFLLFFRIFFLNALNLLKIISKFKCTDTIKMLKIYKY